MSKLWDSDLGIWNLGPFHGTTPRNADIWTFDVKLGKWELWSGTGPHAYVTLFKGEKQVWNKERDKSECDCFSCAMFRPLPPALQKALFEKYKDTPLPHVHVGEESFRKCTEERDVCQGMLPPRPSSVYRGQDGVEEIPAGCHPSDCCGDPEAHNG